MAGEGTMAPGVAHWVGDVLDQPGNWRIRNRIPYLLGFMMLFDSWDSVVIAYTLPSIIAEWQLSAIASGSLISAGYGGQFVGALLFGAVAERYGRLPVLRPLIVVMSLLAIACAFADSYGQLVVLRLVQGIAIGGALPVAICYVNEVAPTATRGKFFGTFQFLMLAGYGLAALASAVIVPEFGWRVMFALGAIPLLAVPLLYRIPESPRWLAARGRGESAASALERLGGAPSATPLAGSQQQEEVKRARLHQLLAPEIRRKSLLTASLWFLTSLVSFGLVTWIPSIYVQIFNIPVADALSYNSIAAVSIFLLPILLRQTIDRIGRRPPAILGTGLGGLALLAMLITPADAWVAVVALLIVGQIGISVSSMVLWPYTAELYPTAIRSVALGAASSLARGASMLTPILVGGVLDLTGSVTLIFLAFGSASIMVSLLWWRGARETAGRRLDA